MWEFIFVIPIQHALSQTSYYGDKYLLILQSCSDRIHLTFLFDLENNCQYYFQDIFANSPCPPSESMHGGEANDKVKGLIKFSFVKSFVES